MNEYARIVQQIQRDPVMAMGKVLKRVHGLFLDAFSIPIRLVCKIRPGKVVFTSNYGRGFSCNPKYIAMEMRVRPEFGDLVWLVNPGEETTLPDYIRPVRYGGLRSVIELASAQIWVDNCRSTRNIRKKNGQYYVQTWHGSMGPKRIEEEALNSLSRRYIKYAIRDASETDLMFANNLLDYERFTKHFWYDGPVIRCGYPRNMPLVLRLDESKAKVFRHYSIPDDRALCLYAPTFRHFGDVDVYRFDYERVCTALRQRFGKEFVFAVRLHPNVASQSSFLRKTIAFDMSGYPDSQELLAAADVLITDYSSILDDHIITRRPSFLYVPDCEEYLARERNLNCTLEERPAPIARSEDELVEQILDYTCECHIAAIDSYLNRWDVREDGHGAEDVVNRIVADLSDMGERE